MKRFVLNSTTSLIEDTFAVTEAEKDGVSLSYNHGRGDDISVIHLQGDDRVLQLRPWILPFQHTHVPYVHTEELNGMITGVRTCIIPVSGFYIWKEAVEDAYPFYVRRHEHPLLAIAAFLMSGEDGKDGVVPLATPANALIKPIHSDMPVFLPHKMVDPWLQGDVSHVLEHCKTDLSLLTDITVFRVSERVNDPEAEGAELIQPIPKRDDDD